MFSQPFFCQSCKSKACSSCGFKATEQWLAQQVHILPDCDWQHITLPCHISFGLFFNNNWLLLNASVSQPLSYAAVGLQTGYRNWYCAWYIYGRQLNQHPHVHVSSLEGFG
ncbi:transposase zinc-binding domain-containing protein (plasmid) [Arsenophonus nasoniae]|nr:transposase zinc-binding domain-containing protein [Arsenophonus nasoniae]WGM18102.1 transposase zinc-binding domain-containing protein [Arsenophonus nasoniae]